MAIGKHSKAISDRSGVEFPYREMVKEWNGAFVHNSEFESKQPQLEPRAHFGDIQGLLNSRSDRTEFTTPIILKENPFTTSSSSTSVTVSITQDPRGTNNNPFETGDAIRFTQVKNAVGGVAINTFELETSLATTISSSDTSITLTDASSFPTSGYIVIKKAITAGTGVDPLLVGTFQNETIQYTGKSSNTLTGCIRGTSAPIQGSTPLATTAVTHNLGAKIFGSYIITRTTSSVTINGVSVPYSFSFTFGLVSAASSAGVGGGVLVFAGPINQRG